MTLEGVNWASMSRRLTRAAHAILKRRSWEEAEDLAQRAIAQLFDDSYAPWDTAKHPDLFDHLAGVMVGLASNMRRDRGRQATSLGDHDAWEDIPSNAATPEEDVAERDHAAKVVADLRVALAGDSEALEVLACFCSGKDSLDAQKKATGLSVAATRNARKRFSRQADAVRARLGGVTPQRATRSAEGDEP